MPSYTDAKFGCTSVFVLSLWDLGVRLRTDAMRQRQFRQKAPEFSGMAVVDGEIKKISLSDYKGKFVVLVFFPLAYTFVCPTEVIAFSERAEEFRKLGAELIMCSIDSPYTLLSWTNIPRQQGGLGAVKVPLLSDMTHKISRDYGVLLEEEGHSLRGNIVIDPKGIVRVIVHHDLPIGRNVDEMVRVIEAIQFTDKHGEVCPINWKKGDSTIKPDPTKKMEYFKTQ